MSRLNVVRGPSSRSLRAAHNQPLRLGHDLEISIQHRSISLKSMNPFQKPDNSTAGAASTSSAASSSQTLRSAHLSPPSAPSPPPSIHSTRLSPSTGRTSASLSPKAPSRPKVKSGRRSSQPKLENRQAAEDSKPQRASTSGGSTIPAGARFFPPSSPSPPPKTATTTRQSRGSQTAVGEMSTGPIKGSMSSMRARGLEKEETMRQNQVASDEEDGRGRTLWQSYMRMSPTGKYILAATLAAGAFLIEFVDWRVEKAEEKGLETILDRKPPLVKRPS